MSIIIQLCGMISSSEENELEGKMLQILFTGEKKNTALFFLKKKNSLSHFLNIFISHIPS